MQGRRTRALDSRGRPVPGLYRRDGRYIAGFKADGRWRMRTLAAHTLTEARRERESLLAGLREGRIAAPAETTFDDLFRDWQDARNLSGRTRAHERHLVARHLPALRSRRAQDVTAAEPPAFSVQRATGTPRGRASRCIGSSAARSRTASAAASSRAPRRTASRRRSFPSSGTHGPSRRSTPTRWRASSPPPPRSAGAPPSASPRSRGFASASSGRSRGDT